MAQTQLPNDLNVVLIGNFGTGKSATGNSLLGKEAFESTGSTSAVTDTTASGVFQFPKGRQLKVVDTVGVLDNGGNFLYQWWYGTKCSTQLRNAMDSAMDYCDNGFHAVLPVFRYDVMRKEERDILNVLVENFGQSFLKDYCIIIFTYGDNFESKMGKKGETFENWCKKQNSLFQELLRKCGNRYLLFDNSTTDKTKQDNQREKLIDMITKLQFNGGSTLTKEKYKSIVRNSCRIM